jgi:hypothetical protein
VAAIAKLVPPEKPVEAGRMPAGIVDCIAIVSARWGSTFYHPPATGVEQESRWVWVLVLVGVLVAARMLMTMSFRWDRRGIQGTSSPSGIEMME